MKKIVGLLVLITAIVLGGIYGMGYVTELTLKKNVNTLNQSNGLVVEITEYHRHWFNSEASFTAKMHIAERVIENQDGKSTIVPAEDYTVIVPVHIYHGPVMKTQSGLRFGIGYAEGQVTLPKEVVEKFATIFDAKSLEPVMNLSVFVNYLVKSRIEMAVPSFKLIPKEGSAEFNWFGMQGDINLSSDRRSISGSLTLDGFKLVKDQGVMTLSKVSSQYDLRRSKEGIYLGQAGFSMPSFTVERDKAMLLSVNELKARSESHIEEGLFSTSFTSSLEKLAIEGKQYGPGAVAISLKNIDAVVLARLNDNVNKMKQTTGVDRQQAVIAMLPDLPKLFSKGALLEISTLKFTMPEGEIVGNLKLSLPKEDINAFQLMSKLQGEATLQVPVAVIKRALTQALNQRATAQNSMQTVLTNQMQANAAGTTTDSKMETAPTETQAQDQKANDNADKKLAALVDAKLLILKDQHYVIDVRLSQGQFTVNGKPFDPATFTL